MKSLNNFKSVKLTEGQSTSITGGRITQRYNNEAGDEVTVRDRGNRVVKTIIRH